LLGGALLVTISVAQSSTSSPSSGSTAQQQVSTELQTNPSPSQNTQSSGEAAGGSQQMAPGTVIPAELAKSVDAKKAKTGDQVVAKTSQDLLSNGQVVIPRGAKIVGHVTQAKAREKGESESTLGIAFDKLVMKDGKELPMNASIQAVGAPVTNFGASNAPMQESSGMPGGGVSGSSNTGMSGGGARNTGSAAGAPTGVPGSPGGNYPQDTGTAGAQGGGRALDAGATGVVGMSGLSLQSGSDGGSVITSQNKNVKLDSGTQVILRVTGK
jgi:hypothetical protein